MKSALAPPVLPDDRAEEAETEDRPPGAPLPHERQSTATSMRRGGLTES